MYIGANPIVLLLLSALLPIIYNFLKKKSLKPVLLIYLCCILVVVGYPLVTYLSAMHPLGYIVGKFLLFVLLPLITVFYIERWKIGKILSELGVSGKNLRRSVLYGLIGSLLMITITLFVSSVNPGFDMINGLILFFESFNEELFFRGFLFLYLMTKTGNKIAWVTSIISFIIIHPQNFDNLFIISTITQALLTTYITYKTKNIIGPSLLHGMNRFFPNLIKSLI